MNIYQSKIIDRITENVTIDSSNNYSNYVELQSGKDNQNLLRNSNYSRAVSIKANTSQINNLGLEIKMLKNQVFQLEKERQEFIKESQRIKLLY